MREESAVGHCCFCGCIGVHRRSALGPPHRPSATPHFLWLFNDSFYVFYFIFLIFFALLHFVLVSWFSSYFPCLQNYLCILHFVSFFYVERLLVAICLRRKLFANKSNKLNNLTQRKLLKWAKIRAVVEVEEAVVEAVLVVAAAAAM